VKLKKFLAIIFAFWAIQLSSAESLRLLLVPLETSIKPRAKVNFDVYVYNSSGQQVKVPSLESLAAFYELNDVTGTRLGRSGGQAQISTGPVAQQTLQQNGMLEKRIAIDIDAERGDLVNVYIKLQNGERLRSNSVLLFCPVKQTKSP
jgi:hypothetical protein